MGESILLLDLPARSGILQSESRFYHLTDFYKSHSARQDIKVKSKFSVGVLIAFLIFSMAPGNGCTYQYSNLRIQSESHETVSQKITKGVTVKAEVLRRYGKPNLISRTASGDELWEYSSIGIFTHLCATIPGLHPRAKEKKFDLTFDQKGVVKDFSFREFYSQEGPQ